MPDLSHDRTIRAVISAAAREVNPNLLAQAARVVRGAVEPQLDVQRGVALGQGLQALGQGLACAAGGLALLAARTCSRRAVRTLPRDVFALLGEAPLGGTHVARVVRFGPKTVLVGVSGSTCTTLAVIEDAHVTEALAAACRAPAPAPTVTLVDQLRTAVARSLAPARRAEAVR